MNKMLKIGHRGAAGYEPENTLISFQKAIEIGVDGIELDVHLSCDSQIMVIHDETIDRTTNGKGVVRKLSLKELKSFRTEKQQEIPTLSEVIDAVNQKCLVNIELKGNGTVKPILDLIESYVLEKNWNYNQFLISSFDWKMLEEVRYLHPDIKIGILTETNIVEAMAFAKTIKAESIHPFFKLITQENTRKMQKEGFQVLAWTVNEPDDIQQIHSLQVNGIISDFPDRL